MGLKVTWRLLHWLRTLQTINLKDRRHFVSLLLAQNIPNLKRKEWSLFFLLRLCPWSVMPRKAFLSLPFMPAWLLEEVCLGRCLANVCPIVKVDVCG